jgi:hypothetical protein
MMTRVLVLMASLLSATTPFAAEEEQEQPQKPAPKTVEECLVERVKAETGREFDFFLECCKGLGSKEEECRARWASQVPEKEPPPSEVIESEPGPERPR